MASMRRALPLLTLALAAVVALSSVPSAVQGRKLMQPSDTADHTGPCRWFLSDGTTAVTDPTQDDITDCNSCATGCAGAIFCFRFSFNGSDVISYTNATQLDSVCGTIDHTGPCRWFLDDGVTPDRDPLQDNITSCTDCQEMCGSSIACIRWSFEGSPVAHFTNDTICSGPQNHTGPCRWYRNDGMTPDSDPNQDAATSCHDCQQGCSSGPTCIRWSFEGSPVALYSNASVCGGGSGGGDGTQNNTGPCRWFLADGVTPDPNTDQNYIDSCADCQSGCQGASDCIRWSFDGSDVAFFSDASVCGPQNHTGPCRWFMSDGVTADPSAAQDTIPTCRQCQADCLEAPNCIFWSFNSSDTMAYNETSDCGVNVTGGLCQWFMGDGVTPSLDEQVNITNCMSCQQQCKDGSTCIYWSFNGSAPTSYGNGCYDHTGPCRWFLSDGSSPDTVDSQDNVTDCQSCQQQCSSASSCLYWSWEEAETLHYTVSDGCSANRTRPCLWYSNATTLDTNDLQGDVRDCMGCQQGCAAANTCRYFSFNGSDLSGYRNESACPVVHTGPCRWFLDDGSADRDARQDGIDSCGACQRACRYAPNCIFWSFNNTEMYRYDNATCNHTGPCRWYQMDGVTPASDEAQDSIYTCTSCQAKCESSAACAIWSFNSSQIAPDSVTGTCGLDVSDGLCQWFLTDGVTPDTTDAQVNITDCNSCQKQCLESGECIYWSFNGSETRNYRAGCGSGQSGACSWYQDDGQTPDTSDTMDNVTDCASCQMLCAVAANCIYWSYNSTEKLHYSVMDGCDANRTRPCQWFLSDGTTPDVQDLQGDVSTCDNCHSLCAEAEHCYFSAFNGSDVARYNETNACGPDSSSGCAWFLSDGETPDTDGGSANADSCGACLEGCAAANNCMYFSYNDMPVTSYTNDTACDAAPAPGGSDQMGA